MRKLIAALCVCSMMAVVGVSPAVAAGNNSNQTGLVNVSLGDVALLNNVNLAVAANLAATVCGVTVPVAVLAHQVGRRHRRLHVRHDDRATVCDSGAERVHLRSGAAGTTPIKPGS